MTKQQNKSKKTQNRTSKETVKSVAGRGALHLSRGLFSYSPSMEIRKLIFYGTHLILIHTHILFTLLCLHLLRDNEPRCSDRDGSARSRLQTSGSTRGRLASGVRSGFSRRPRVAQLRWLAGLVYWWRDSQKGRRKEGEPEGEQSVNGTGIQVFTLDPCF